MDGPVKPNLGAGNDPVPFSLKENQDDPYVLANALFDVSFCPFAQFFLKFGGIASSRSVLSRFYALGDRNRWDSFHFSLAC